MHALIIDDNPTNTEVLAQLLENQAISATLLHDPTHLDKTMTDIDRLDIVFLDLELPKINGYDVLRVLQKDYELQIPIVAYTVHISEINTARQHGFHSFLGKPLRAEDFPRQLQRILNDEPVWEM